MKNNLLMVSLLTVTCLYGILAGLFILIFMLAGVSITYVIIPSIIILLLQFLISPVINDFVFKHFYGADFNAEVPDKIKNLVYEVCDKYNMKYPKMAMINDGNPNAFTYGRTKNSARVIFTRGIIDLLNEEEAKAVIAHELGHAVHYDMLLMTMAQVVPLVLYYIYEVCLKNRSRRSSRKNSKGDITPLIGLIAYILYIIAQYIILWLSRTREYYADNFAVEETKNPTAMAEALVKIGLGLATGTKEESKNSYSNNTLGISNSKISKGIAIASYNDGEVSKENIVNAMKWEQWNVWAKWNEFNSTHPLTSKRILAISKRCEDFAQAPYIEFNEQKPESYLDDFLIELFIKTVPSVLTIALVCVLTLGEVLSKTAFFLTSGIIILLLGLSLNIYYGRRNKNKDFENKEIRELLSEVKVSDVTAVPCIVTGKVIGRGNPGCIFNEDFVIDDGTGIMFLDYNQPLSILEKYFAIFRSKEFFDKEVTICGWYRRGLAPYIEVKTITVDGLERKCHTFTVRNAINKILFAVGILFIILALL